MTPTVKRILGALPLVLMLALAPQITQAALAAEKINFCHASSASVLVPLAMLLNYYADEGLDVQLQLFNSGKQALEAMFAGKCVLLTSAETPVVYNSLTRNDFLIIASVAKAGNFEKIIVRNDRGILKAADLRGRRIGVAKFTTAHYFLELYLLANGLSPQDVVEVYLTPDDVMSAFRRGDVDAVAHWEPNIQVLAREFLASTKTFSAPGLHVSRFLLTGNRDYVRKNPAVIERVLRALVRAERFAREQPAKARAALAGNFVNRTDELDLIWSMNDFRIELDQQLFATLENTARWEIGLLPPAKRPALPNYLDFIYFNGLQAVNPDALTIIH